MLAITAPGVTWEHHAWGFGQISFPVMPDSVGTVQSLYSATTYDLYMVDRQGRMVEKIADFSDKNVNDVAKKVKELHAQ